MTSTTIISTIINQLGGGPALKAMISAKDFVRDGENKIAFKFSGCRKANYCRVSLVLGSDTYSVELIKIGRLNKKTWKFSENVTHKEFTGIYGDQLKELFERHTGLLLSL